MLDAATKQYVDAVRTLVTGSYLPLTGGALSGGLGLGNVVAPGGIADVTRHIALWGTTFGLNVTSNRLGIVAPGNGVIANNVGGADRVTISQTIVTATLPVIVNASGTGWSSNNFGQQLLIQGNRNNALGIGDNTGANYVTMANASGVLVFAAMPLPSDNTTGITSLLSLSTTGHTFSNASVTLAPGFGLITPNANVAAVPTDLTKHINLYGGTYGLSITSNRLNILGASVTS